MLHRVHRDRLSSRELWYLLILTTSIDDNVYSCATCANKITSRCYVGRCSFCGEGALLLFVGFWGEGQIRHFADTNAWLPKKGFEGVGAIATLHTTHSFRLYAEKEFPYNGEGWRCDVVARVSKASKCLIRCLTIGKRFPCYITPKFSYGNNMRWPLLSKTLRSMMCFVFHTNHSKSCARKQGCCLGFQMS